MARYQILYWRHIPLGIKAVDINETVRKNLPRHFWDKFEAFKSDRSQSTTAPYTTSGFRWGEQQEREGSAAEVAAALVEEISSTWQEEKALASFDEEEPEKSGQFLDLNDL